MAATGEYRLFGLALITHVRHCWDDSFRPHGGQKCVAAVSPKVDFQISLDDGISGRLAGIKDVFL